MLQDLSKTCTRRSGIICTVFLWSCPLPSPILKTRLKPQGEKQASKIDYGAVREAISDLLEAEDYDDGANPPSLI
jgi:hypothetical protein